MNFRRLAILCGISAIACAPGCVMKGEPAPPPSTAANANLAAWQIMPVQMRVLPSTRFVQLDKQILLESRVEFQDELQDTIKAAGTFQFEVFAVNRQGQLIESQKLFSWKLDVLTREANKEFYDPVTRAYLFRLEVDQLPTLQRVALRVTFVPPAGKRLEVTAIVGIG